MTVITNFKFEGPHDSSGDASHVPSIMISWQQTKVIVEELNRREAERVAIHEQEIAEKGLQGCPEGCDVGAIRVLAGCCISLLHSMGPHNDVPGSLLMLIELIVSQVAPEDMQGPVLMALAMKLTKKPTENMLVKDISQLKADDKTVDEVTKLLEEIRKKKLN